MINENRSLDVQIKWRNYSATENTWEPAKHLTEDLIASFEKRSVDVVRADECSDRRALLFESGLKAPLIHSETIRMRHDVVRAVFPGLPQATQ